MTVEAYLLQYTGEPWQRFYYAHQEAFEKAPAGETRHHNFTGGLSVHTAEVMRTMLELRDSLNRTRILTPNETGFSVQVNEDVFTDEDIVVSAFLHDFAKIEQYRQDDQGDWRFSKMGMPQETWTLMRLAQHGVPVTDAQATALLYAEGGFSEFLTHGEPNSLAWLLHMADIWSSQLIRPTVVTPVCPRCGKPMKKRSGTRGVFWGCTGYPACSMTINVEVA